MEEVLGWVNFGCRLPPKVGQYCTPIHTVGDVSGFSRNGGMVELFLQDGKVRFEINLAAARQSRLKISSQLLKVARIVRDNE
jgi:hypothetical protein